MRSNLKAALIVALGVGGTVFAQALRPGGGGCATGSNCSVSTLTATKTTGASVSLSGDAGVLFGDGTSQNTAATAFSGSATSYAATAAVNTFAFKSNQGGMWCLDPTCFDRFQADGGYSAFGHTTGIYAQAAVADSSSNAAFLFNATNPAGGALLNADIFSFRNAGSVLFSVGNTSSLGGVSFAGGAVTASGGTYTYRVQSGSNSAVQILGTGFTGSSYIANQIGNASALSTLGDLITAFYSDAYSTMKASIDKDGNFKNAAHLNCAMSAATTCTATVPTGDVCMCQARSGTNSALSCAVSSTTATCTASGSNSDTWNIWVW